jgi:Ca2+-transporting ATPase
VKQVIDHNDPNSSSPIPYETDASTLAEYWQVSPKNGLSTIEAVQRLKAYGHNELREIKKANPILVFASQFASPVVLILAFAAVFSVWMNEWAEFIAIMMILMINSIIGFVTEWRAIKSMAALRQMSSRTLIVRRDAQRVKIQAVNIVPGDIMLLEAGDIVSADARLISAANMSSDESALTGESEPSIKTTEQLSSDIIVAERSNMLHKGCAINSGIGEAIVVGTGMHTELGRISALIESSADTHSPLEKQLASLTRDLIGFTVIVTALVGISGFLAGQPWDLMVQSAVALAVATIPEGLPIVATLALARGMRSMARHNALIERLAAVETLGATTVIMTDKTGTLTENDMRVACIVTTDKQYSVAENRIDCESYQTLLSDERSPLSIVLRTAVLCNNASLSCSEGESTGDPMEVSLLRVASNAEVQRSILLKQFPEVRQIPFHTATRRMATVHQDDAHFFVAVKGAPEAIFDITQTVKDIPFDAQTRQSWVDVCSSLASDGLRVLAIAGKLAETADTDPFDGLTLFGVVGFRDPPRADVAESISQINSAGVSVVMVTGDHPQTASYIAHSIGITSHNTPAMSGNEIGNSSDWDERTRKRLRAQKVFSRVSPEQKLELLSLHQATGNVVAMTGDGINDAPALKKADIGIAMGIRGTQVAKEAADMILRDDAFSTIVHAIAEGRVIYTNIRRFTLYLLSCNLSEILVVSIAILVGLPLPLLPLQILFLNLVTDVFPAFALGTVKEDRDVLSRNPRSPQEKILGKRQYWYIVAHSASITAATLLALGCALHVLHLPDTSATTVSFYTLALAQTWHVFNMRNWRDRWTASAVTRSGYIWAAVILCLLLLGLANFIPVVSDTLKLQSLEASTWLYVFAFSLLPVIAREAVAAMKRFRHTNNAPECETKLH